MTLLMEIPNGCVALTPPRLVDRPSYYGLLIGNPFLMMI